MKFIKCDECKGTDFKINPYTSGISIICSHCLNEIQFTGCDSLCEIVKKYKYTEVEE